MTTVKQKHGSQLGRPVTIDANRYIGLRLPSDLLNKIDEYAEAKQVQRSEAMRELLERALVGVRRRGVSRKAGA